MLDPKRGVLLSSMARLMTEKKELVAREREFVDGLNHVLNEMGYAVVPVEVPAGRRGAARRRVARRRTRGTPRPARAGRKPGAKPGARRQKSRRRKARATRGTPKAK
jgi:hypothetical protein